MSRDLVAGEVKYLDLGLVYKDVDKDYLEHKKPAMEKILNLILDLICKKKEKSEILTEVLKDDINNICRVNKSSDYKDNFNKDKRWVSISTKSPILSK